MDASAVLIRFSMGIRVRVSLLLSVLLCVLAFGNAGFSGITFDSPGKLFIVCIGVDQIKGRSEFHLKFAQNDANELAKVLQANGKYLYDSADVTVLQDAEATTDRIVGALDKVARSAASDDTFIFLFAGLGTSVKNEFYVYPYDSAFDEQAHQPIGISNEYLQSLLRKIRARRKAVILDTGDFRPDESSLFDKSSGTSLADSYFFLVGDNNSYELLSHKHGALTYVLLKGLAGEADLDHSGIITTRELEAYMFVGSLGLKSEFRELDFHPKIFSKRDFPVAYTPEKVQSEAKRFALMDQLNALQRQINDLAKMNPSVGSAVQLEKRRRAADAFIAKPNEQISGYDAENLAEALGLKEQQFSVTESLDTNKISGFKDLALQDRRNTDAKIAALRNRSDLSLTKYFALQQQATNISNQLPGRSSVPLTRGSEPLDGDKPTVARTGKDYALLFANWTYEKGWRELKNPLSDVNAIAEELQSHYGFAPENIDIKKNLSAEEIERTVAEYQKKFFAAPGDDSQLFILFSGHGYGEQIENGPVNGYFVGRDSEYPFSRRNSGTYVRLDDLLGTIDSLPIKHIFVVFDACYAGVIWKPSVIIQKSASLPRLHKDDFMASIDPLGILASFAALNSSPKVFMKERSRVSMTSGDEPVLDARLRPDGTYSDHSPFAEDFLRALRSNGNTEANHDDILTTKEIEQFTIGSQKTERGIFGGERADGDFVFIHTPSTTALRLRPIK
jgi:hypothetical protein